jgi:cytoskeleton protein RodZ
MDAGPDTTERPQAPHSPGAILAAERERQGLSRTDIAQRLHMSASQVEALEVSDYSRLPHGTFLRGFTRNYARALGLDAAAIVDMLAEDAPQEKAPGIVVPTQNIRFDPLGQRLANPYVKAAGIAAAVIVLGFAVMYWWLFIRTQGAPVTAPVAAKPAVVQKDVAPAPAPAATDAPKAEGPGAEPQQPAADAQPSVTLAATPAAPESPPAEAARAPNPGEGHIHLAFRGAAWVEITDARGKVVVSRTHAGGSTAEAYGKPPFNVVVGNAPEVRLTYNGRAVDLEPHTRVAVARFTLQ